MSRCMRCFFHRLYRFALSMTRNGAEAEEIVQETFLKALQHGGRLPADANVDAWLFRIARNIHISRLRKRRRETGSDELDRSAAAEDIVELLTDKDSAYRILTALHSLKEPYKEVFTLHTLGDVSYKQISALFGKSESWARVTYHRARMMLIDTMQEEETP